MKCGYFSDVATCAAVKSYLVRVMIYGARIRGSFLSESSFPIISTFFSRNFSIFHIFLIYFYKYVKFNELDFFAFGEFPE